MRKHFLILMLLTLLPFTAWAVTPKDISTYEVVFGTYAGGTFTPATITYNGGEQNFPNVVLKKGESGSETYLTTGFSATVWTYKGATVTKITEAGKYTVTIQADGGESATLTGNTTGEFKVGKAPITVKGKNITDGVTFGDALTASGAYFTKVGSKSFEATYTFPEGFNETKQTTDKNQFKAAQVFSTDYTQWADVTTASSKYKIIPVVANLNTTFTNYEFTAENGALTVKAKTLLKWYDVAKDLKDHPYDGFSYMPVPTITDPDRKDDPATSDKDESKLVKGTDYTLAYYLADSQGKLVKASSGSSNPYTNAAGTEDNTKDVGKYFVVIAGKGNYASPEAGAYEEPYFIIKNVLGVSTKGGKSTYGDTPTLTGLLSFKGLAAGESFNNAAIHDAGVLNKNVSFVAVMTGKNQGTYPVTAKAILTTPAPSTSGSSTGGSAAAEPTVTDVADEDVAKNYVPSYFNNGVWTIEKKPLEFKLKAQSITNGVSSELSSAEGVQITATNFSDYFEAITLAYTDKIATYPKVKLNDKDQIVVEGTFTFNNGEDEDSEEYADVTDNYDVKAIAPVAVTRKDGTLTIFVTDFTKNYGDTEETLTVDVVGGTPQANTDAKAAFEELLTVAKTGKAVNDEGEVQASEVTYPNAGIYNIVVGDYSKATLPAGYDIRVLNGTYTILKRELKSINPIAQTVPVNATVANLTPASATTVKFVQKDDDEYDITDTDMRLLYEEIIAADGTALKGFKLAEGTETTQKGNFANKIEMVDLANKLRNFKALATGKAALIVAEVATANVVLDRTITKDPTEDNVTKTVKTTIHSNKDKIANVKFGTRVLGSQKWNAFVLPFTISAADLSQAVGYAVFNVVDEANSDESHARFKLYMGIIEANTPFLMKTDKEIDMKDIPAIQGVQIVENLTPSVKVAGDIKFKGTYEQTLMKANNRWVVNDVWKEGTGKGGVLALTSYLEYPEGTNAPEIILEEADGSTTAISAITADGEAVEATGWYTLNGIQLQGAPTEKGVYVRNGKKVVIK